MIFQAAGNSRHEFVTRRVISETRTDCAITIQHPGHFVDQDVVQVVRCVALEYVDRELHELHVQVPEPTPGTVVHQRELLAVLLSVQRERNVSKLVKDTPLLQDHLPVDSLNEVDEELLQVFYLLLAFDVLLHVEHQQPLAVTIAVVQKQDALFSQVRVEILRRYVCRKVLHGKCLALQQQ
jgi:hypothetical protein